jgi:hypothetical protein
MASGIPGVVVPITKSFSKIKSLEYSHVLYKVKIAVKKEL